MMWLVERCDERFSRVVTRASLDYKGAICGGIEAFAAGCDWERTRTSSRLLVLAVVVGSLVFFFFFLHLFFFCSSGGCVATALFFVCCCAMHVSFFLLDRGR